MLLSGRTYRSILLLAALVRLAGCNDTGTPAPIRGPQVSRVTSDSAVISWESEKSGRGKVELWRGGMLEVVGTAATETTRHSIELAPLDVGAEYVYSLLVDDAVQHSGHRLRLLDPANPTLRVVVLGDCGTGGPVQRSVGRSMLAWDPHLALLVGDAAYESGSAYEVSAHFFDPFRDLIDHIPFYVALGNHDVRTDDGGPLLDALYLPTNDADGSERFYSFDAGDAHFVALDSTRSLTPGSLQHDWLTTDLMDATATWKIVFFHHPPYSSSRHGSSLTIRTALDPLFASEQVDMVLTGHDHVYERSLPIENGSVVDADQEPDYTDPTGTIFVVTGGGGRGLYESGTSFFTAATRAIHHHVRLEFEPGRVTLMAVDRDGAILDRATITKTAP